MTEFLPLILLILSISVLDFQFLGFSSIYMLDLSFVFYFYPLFFWFLESDDLM